MRIEETEKGQPPKVTLTARDRRRLHEILRVLGPRVQLEEIGRYTRFDSADWWRLLVDQVCVMGGSRGLEKARKNPEFEQEIALDRCIAEPEPWSRTPKPLRPGA